jgi:hypothetical protein
VLVSLVAGSLTLVGHEFLVDPWNLFGDSIGTWCLFPFVAGRRATSLWRAAAAGVACLLALDMSYYVSLIVLTGRGDFASSVFFWVISALPVGLVLGITGRISTRRVRFWSILNSIPGAIFIYEVSPWADLHDFPTVQDKILQGSWVVAGLAITVILAQSPVRRAIALAALPIFLLGAASALMIALSIFQRMTSTL